MDYGSERLQNGLRYESPTDIFHTQRWDSESHLPNLDLYAYGNSESRQLKLNFTYQFGKAKEAHVNELEEVQRLWFFGVLFRYNGKKLYLCIWNYPLEIYFSRQ